MELQPREQMLEEWADGLCNYLNKPPRHVAVQTQEPVQFESDDEEDKVEPTVYNHVSHNAWMRREIESLLAEHDYTLIEPHLEHDVNTCPAEGVPVLIQHEPCRCLFRHSDLIHITSHKRHIKCTVCRGTRSKRELIAHKILHDYTNLPIKMDWKEGIGRHSYDMMISRVKLEIDGASHHTEIGLNNFNNVAYKAANDELKNVAHLNSDDCAALFRIDSTVPKKVLKEVVHFIAERCTESMFMQQPIIFIGSLYNEAIETLLAHQELQLVLLATSRNDVQIVMRHRAD